MFAFIALISALLFGLFYWLLPVAPQSMGSADAVRISVSTPIEGASLPAALPSDLSALWVESMRLARSLVGAEYSAGVLLYPTMASLQVWFVILSFALVLWAVMRASGVRDKGFGLLIAATLSPAFLWSSVVPNGFGLGILMMTVAWFLRRNVFVAGPSAPPSNQASNQASNQLMRRLSYVIEGFSLGVTVAAFLPALGSAFAPLLNAANQAGNPREISRPLDSKKNQLVQSGLRLLGFFMVFLADGHWTAIEILKALPNEDRLGAAVVILGGGGEYRLGLVGGLSWGLMLVALALVIDSRSTLKKKNATATRSALPVPVAAIAALSAFCMFMQWGLFATRAPAWRLAHPGWNSVLYDSVKNIEASVSMPVTALVTTRTEWSLAQYHRLMRKTGSVDVQLSAATDDDIQKRLTAKESLWVPGLPSIEKGARIQFLGYGLLVTSLDSPSAPTEFYFGMDGVKRVRVVAPMDIQNYVEPIPLEVAVYSRYATYHMATARVYRKKKETVDWERRANLEDFAALRKVPWNKEAYKAVCLSSFAGQEPDDYCQFLANFHVDSNAPIKK